MRGRAIAIALGLAAIGGCGGDSGGGDAPATPRAVALSGCWMTVHLHGVPAARVRPFLPPGVRVGGYLGRRATLAIWALSCDRAAAGGRPRPAAMTLVGVQIAPPGTRDDGGPANFHHYLLGADTDSPALRRALRAAGQPVRLVPGLRLRRGARVRVTNPAARGGFETSIGAVELDRPHRHDNVFWFGPAHFALRVPRANDRYCVRPDRRCVATTSAPPGSRLWRLLGGRDTVDAHTAFDHLRIPRATIDPG